MGGRVDGIIYKNVFASYTHIHASGVPTWAQSFVSLASRKARGGNPASEDESSQEVGHG
jgi:cobyrinic acid a,c-diamide synthase